MIIFCGDWCGFVRRPLSQSEPPSVKIFCSRRRSAARYSGEVARLRKYRFLSLGGMVAGVAAAVTPMNGPGRSLPLYAPSGTGTVNRAPRYTVPPSAYDAPSAAYPPDTFERTTGAKPPLPLSITNPDEFARQYFASANKGNVPLHLANKTYLGVSHNEPESQALLKYFFQHFLRPGDTVLLENIDYGRAPDAVPPENAVESYSYAEMIRKYGPPGVNIKGWDMPAAQKQALRSLPSYPHRDGDTDQFGETHETDLTVYERNNFMKNAVAREPGRTIVLTGLSHLWDPTLMAFANAQGSAIFSLPTRSESFRPATLSEPLFRLQPKPHQLKIAAGQIPSYPPSPDLRFGEKPAAPPANPAQPPSLWDRCLTFAGRLGQKKF